MQELPLNGFYSGESQKNSDRRCINFIPTGSDSGALSQFSLMPSTGITQSNTNNSYRSTYLSGLISSQVFNDNGLALFSVGNDIVRHNGISVSGVLTLAPTPTGGGTVPGTAFEGRFATNGADIVLVGSSYSNNNRDRAYVIDSSLASTAIDIETIMGTSNAGLIDVAYFGGRFLYLFNNQVSTENAVYYSSLGGTDPNALDFFRPDTNNEQLKGMEVVSNSLYVFAETKTYIYQITESVDIPYRQVGTIDYGLYENVFNSANSKARYKGTVAFVGREDSGKNRVYVLNGGSAQAISTPDIDYQLDQDDSSFRVFTFSEKGRYFFCVRGASFTYIYDSSTGVWHERITNGDNRWKFIGAVSDGGNTIFVGDQVEDLSPTARFYIGLEDDSTGRELGDLVERTVITSPYNNANDRLLISELQPMCEVDFNSNEGDWPKPKINLSVSYDFGNTFDSERSSSIGLSGNYKQETRFLGVGYATQAFTVMLRTINPYPTRILKLLSRITKGSY